VRRHRWTAAASTAALLAACASGPDADGPATSAETPAANGPTEPTPPAAAERTPDPPPAPDVDDGLLDFTGRQLDGGTFDGAAVTGDVAVWFWTPW
jgi:hypothetical protein